MLLYIKKERKRIASVTKENRLILEHKQLYYALCTIYILNILLHKHNIHVWQYRCCYKNIRGNLEKKKRICSIYTYILFLTIKSNQQVIRMCPKFIINKQISKKNNEKYNDNNLSTLAALRFLINIFKAMIERYSVSYGYFIPF